MGHMKVPKYRKKRLGHNEGPRSIEKNDEHMKAHKEKIS